MQNNTDRFVLTTPDQATATRGRARHGEAGARDLGGGSRQGIELTHSHTLTGDNNSLSACSDSENNALSALSNLGGESTQKNTETGDKKIDASGDFAADGGALGLSTCQNSPQKRVGRVMRRREDGKRRRSRYSLAVAEGGRILHLKESKGGGESTPGRRAAITGFTPSARANLLRRIAMIDTSPAGLPKFVALTYPAEFPTSGRVVKRHLDIFLKRVKRQYETEQSPVWGFWKLEPQQRGAPHYHLLVWGVPSFPHVVGDSCMCPLCWVAQSWYEIVASGDVRHRRAGTRVESVTSWSGVTAYAAKYLGKAFKDVTGIWSEVGRFWGVFGRRHMPVRFSYKECSPAEFFRLRRSARILLGKAGRRGAFGSATTGNWVFCTPDTGSKFSALLTSVHTPATSGGTAQMDTQADKDTKRDADTA